MDFNNIKLNCYGNITVSANIEESIEDIETAVLYDDHGDEYLVVRTKDGAQHEYGYYMNRKWAPNNPEDLGENYVRKPVVFKMIDKYATTSNRVYDYISDRVLKCLERNGIATPENLKMLDEAHFSSKNEDGIDGIAARKIIAGSVICADSIEAVYHDGKWLDKSEYIITESQDYDEYGYYSYYFNMSQFDSGEKERVIDNIHKRASYIKETVDKMISDLDNSSLELLYEIEDILDGVSIYEPSLDEEDEEDEED